MGAHLQTFAAQDEHYIGISQSRNRGHQNAVLAGLMEALHSGTCDITISIDCDGQDDINAMDEMVQKYLDGAEVVYGVRSRRDTDTFFKRFTAEGFYHVMNALGADIVFNHADYRLISTRVLESFADYKEVNIFLRGMVPLVGFQDERVTYERHERLAGESHYPLSKMLALAFDGITSLSNKPIRHHHRGRHRGQPDQLHRGHLGHRAGRHGQQRGRLGLHRLHRLLHGRRAAGVPGRHRRIHRQDLYGDESPPALHHQSSAPGPPTKGSITDEQTELAGQHPAEPGTAGAGVLRRAGEAQSHHHRLERHHLHPAQHGVHQRSAGAYSHHLIQESGQFAINLPTEALVRSVDWCGVKSGRDVDKFARLQPAPAPGTVLTDCPILEESPVNLECRVTQVIPLGSHDLFLAEWWPVDVDESLLDENGKLCLDKAKLIVYSHGEYLAWAKSWAPSATACGKRTRKTEKIIYISSLDFCPMSIDER